jgi:hypothetical protein
MSGLFSSITKFVQGALTSSYQVGVVKEGKPLAVRPVPAPTTATAPAPAPGQNKPKKGNGGGAIF